MNRVGLLLFVAVGVEYVILVSAMDIKKKEKSKDVQFWSLQIALQALKLGGKW